jgi:rhamnose utilization protein RhaD (predicted bifunctional aldolase and dehydrogenase)/NAD(P)-dependent dehydrogenase (short-subunit alcohol dehydrogenase family)
MLNRWNESEAKKFRDDLSLRVYSSRLLGADPCLVLHGGGNTSVKTVQKNVLGEDEEILFVKGSGWDLATIEAEGYSPVQLQHLKKLAALPQLSDLEMVNEMLTHMTRASAPSPSVEAILHAILPHKFVDHTHADAIVTITNSVDGEKRIREIYGDDVVVIPYVMPGFDLARLCAAEFPKRATAKTIGMVLLNHGIFSFGSTARESYERMVELVTRAEEYLQSKKAWTLDSKPKSRAKPANAVLPELRKKISDAAGFPVVMTRQSDDRSLAFAQRSDLSEIALRGPATPDHVIRTKRIPLIGRDVGRFVSQYKQYFSANEPAAKHRKKMLDAAPRVLLDPELGLCTVGRTARDAQVAADIYSHTIEIIARAEILGGYRALAEKDIFDVEYWDLEQAKLAKAPAPRVFSGEVVLITGAASGIGKACVDSFLARGAAVAGLDKNPAIAKLNTRPDFIGVECDVTSQSQLELALGKTVDSFGGVDMLVLNAGIFPGGRQIAELALDEWRSVMQVNLDSNLILMRLAHPLLKQAPRGGRVAVIGSKNVAAPGPGAAAYSASKAALNQLARIAALEWGADNIRVNSLHPHAVFDTGLWTEDVLASRAKSHGVTIEEYKTNNVLKTEITSRDVAELAAELCSPVFAKTTGAQIPVDGGSDRII